MRFHYWSLFLKHISYMKDALKHTCFSLLCTFIVFYFLTLRMSQGMKPMWYRMEMTELKKISIGITCRESTINSLSISMFMCTLEPWLWVRPWSYSESDISMKNENHCYSYPYLLDFFHLYLFNWRLLSLAHMTESDQKSIQLSESSIWCLDAWI